MKFSQVVIVAALFAGLATGCARKPKNITPLPSSERVGGKNTDLAGGGGPIQDNTGRNLPNRGPTLPPVDGTGARDVPPPVTTQENVIPPKDPGETPQADRSKWETWPQDPDTLRGDTVYFDFDKSVVKRGESAKVSKIADYLKSHPSYMLKLDGHADERGTEDYNRALGERRALSVREMLLNLGIAHDRVVTATFGEDRPAELGHNEAAWSKNRRAEPVLLIPPGAAR